MGSIIVEVLNKVYCRRQAKSKKKERRANLKKRIVFFLCNHLDCMSEEVADTR